jgi:hypothetical protein
MSNPIVYSPQALTNALNKGYFYIGTNDIGKGPTSSTGYFDGVTPSNSQYVIYYYKNDSTKVYYCINGDQVYTITNRLKSQNFTTLESALNYIATQGDMMCVNRQYEPIVTDGLIFNLDAGFVPSYPMTNTTWYDLSNNDKDGTLTNGPTFNSENGGSIVFDGVDDEISFTNNTFGYSPGTTGEISLEIWIYPTGPYSSYVAEPPTTNLGGFLGQGYFGGTTGWGLGMFGANSNNYFAFQVRNQGTIVQTGINSNHIFTNNSWYHVVGSFTRNDFSRVYINGVLASSTSSTPLNNISITPNQSNAKIGRINSFYSGCRIPVARIYNRPLSTSEVLQNYNAQKGRFGL